MVKKNIRIKRQSTMALKALVWLLGLIVLALCVFALPAGIISEHAGMYRPLLLGMYIPAIPFFIGMFQTLRLLRNIDQNRAFSTDSYESLKVIKVCAFGPLAIAVCASIFQQLLIRALDIKSENELTV
jgi:hypothetical protein